MMRDELQKKLFKKYPDLFWQRDLSASKSNMVFGFECDDGWYHILDGLCRAITNHVKSEISNAKYRQTKKELVNFNDYRVSATQVKEKFGGLRFYISGGDDHVYGMIHLAEEMSYITCEKCAQPGALCSKVGWLKTLCPECQEKDEYNVNQDESDESGKSCWNCGYWIETTNENKKSEGRYSCENCGIENSLI